MSVTEKIETFSCVTTSKKQSQILFSVIFKQEEAVLSQVLSAAEGSHLPVHAQADAHVRRNVFRPKFAHNNTTIRPSNFNTAPWL